MPAPHLCLRILSCLYWSFVTSSLEHPPLSVPPQQMAFLLLTTQAGKLGITPFESIPIPLPGTTLPPKHLIHPLSICIPPSLTQTPISHLDYLSSLPIVLPSTLTPSLTGVPFPAQSAFYNANLIILLLCLKPTKGFKLKSRSLL